MNSNDLLGIEGAPLAAALRAVSGLDELTLAHSCRVSVLCGQVAAEMGLGLERVHLLALAGLFHDAGKIEIPAKILLKPGPLSRDEYEVVKQHPSLGGRLLRSLGFPPDGDIVDGARSHHERFDGLGGYPDGLAGHAIPLAGRVVGVADGFDAMTSVRTYARVRNFEEAVDELSRQIGLHFDPDACLALLRVLRNQFQRRCYRGGFDGHANSRLGLTGDNEPSTHRAAEAKNEV